jgi:hypothetical protein
VRLDHAIQEGRGVTSPTSPQFASGEVIRPRLSPRPIRGEVVGEVGARSLMGCEARFGRGGVSNGWRSAGDHRDRREKR